MDSQSFPKLPAAAQARVAEDRPKVEHVGELTRHSMATAFALAMLAGMVAACGSDLGACDPAAAEELVYSSNGMVATKGQALLNDSCGNGVFCHSSAAEGEARHGAPAGMNFDMLPAASGWPEVIDRREDIWDAVESGQMPPVHVGDTVRGDNGWVFDPDRRPDAVKLAPIAAHEGKSAVRNWLACGAPLVGQTQLPAWAQPSAPTSSAPDAGVGNGFDAVFSEVLRTNCALAGCHNASAAGNLKMLDACSTFAELTRPSACGAPRVRAGDTGSALLDKIASRTPACGGPMPPAGALSPDKVALVRTWIEMGAQGPDCGGE